jgi:hypothetical protein
MPILTIPNNVVAAANPPLIKSVTRYIVASLVAANAATYVQSGTTVTITSAAHTMTAGLNGGNIFLLQGTVSSGVAPTSAVAGMFTNFQYIDANTFSVQATNSQNATGNFLTNTAITTITPLNFTIPANSLSSGNLKWNATLRANSSAGTKTARIQAGFGAQGLSAKPMTTGGLTLVVEDTILMSNNGSTQSQIDGTVGGGYKSFDATADIAGLVSIQITSASQYMCFEFIEVKIE